MCSGNLPRCRILPRWEDKFQQAIHNMCHEQWETETFCKQLIVWDDVTLLCLKARVHSTASSSLTSWMEKFSLCSSTPGRKQGWKQSRKISTEKYATLVKFIPQYFSQISTILEWVKFCANSFKARFLICSRTGTLRTLVWKMKFSSLGSIYVFCSPDMKFDTQTFFFFFQIYEEHSFSTVKNKGIEISVLPVLC